MGFMKSMKRAMGKPSRKHQPLVDPLVDPLTAGGLGGASNTMTSMLQGANDIGFNIDNPMRGGPSKKEAKKQAKAKKKQAKRDAKLAKNASKGKSVMKDRHVRSIQAGAGGGSANDVKRVHYNRGIDDTGATDGFFKADWNPELINQGQDDSDPILMPGLGYMIGIEDDDARNAARAVASSRVDELLGTQVLSQDRFARHDGQDGVVSPTVAGTALSANVYGTRNLNNKAYQGDPRGPGYASPESAAKANAVRGGTYKIDGDAVYKREGLSTRELDTTNANVQRGMSNLQVNDYLTGQIDRHAQNIYADATGNITGIDNDLAFGTSYGQDYDKSGAGMHNKGLPELIDGNLAEHIQRMDEESFRASIAGRDGDLNHLNHDEIEAAMGRFRRLKAHIEEMLANPQAPDDRLVWDWGGEQIRDRMIGNGNNYLARHERSRAEYVAEQQGT